MADWDTITRQWVSRGLIEEEQQEALLTELRALPPEAPILPIGSLVTLLIAGSCWLMTAAIFATLVTIVSRQNTLLLGGLIGAVGMGIGTLGAVMRAAPALRSIARGLLAASPPLLTCALSLAAGIDTNHPAGASILLLPALVSLPVAFAEGSRSWAATSAICLAVSASIVLKSPHPLEGSAWPGLLMTMLGLGALSALSRLLPARAATFQAAIPFAFIYLTAATIDAQMLFYKLWQQFGVRDAQEAEKSLLVICEGVILVAFGMISRSGFTLVPALLFVSAGAVALANALNSWRGSTMALGVVSGLFLFGALVLWVLRASSERGASARR